MLWEALCQVKCLSLILCAVACRVTRHRFSCVISAAMPATRGSSYARARARSCADALYAGIRQQTHYRDANVQACGGGADFLSPRFLRSACPRIAVIQFLVDPSLYACWTASKSSSSGRTCSDDRGDAAFVSRSHPDPDIGAQALGGWHRLECSHYLIVLLGRARGGVCTVQHNGPASDLTPASEVENASEGAYAASHLSTRRSSAPTVGGPLHCGGMSRPWSDRWTIRMRQNSGHFGPP
jgi:hypothetical protein